MQDITIQDATGAADIDAMRQLTEAYAQWIADDHGISLDFQGIDEELASLPGKYAPPRGALMIARNADGTAIGCVALRELASGDGEIKRLYVLPAARGTGLGRRLCGAIIDRAKELNYRRLVLDTGLFMKDAQALYERFGFKDIEPYYDNPFEARFLGLDL